MNKKFCQKCNKPTFYEDSLPRGCSHCLSPFASTTASQSFPEVEFEEESPRPVMKIKRPQKEQTEYRPQSARLKRRSEPEYEEDDENNYETSGEFEPPEIEVENIPERQRIRAENIVFDKSTAPKEVYNRPKLKLNKKQIEEDFRNSINKGGKNNPIEILGN